MNGKDLLEGMNYIDEKFIEEAEKQEDSLRRDKGKRTSWKYWGALAACFGLVMVAVVAGIPGLQEHLGQGDTESSDNSQTEQADEKKMYQFITYNSSEMGEFAGDMHRPEGYHENIGSALALKMSLNEDEDYQFNTIVYSYGNTIEAVVEMANSTSGQKLDISEWTEVRTAGSESTIEKYYNSFTSEEIHALANAGARCMYVGSGKGDVTSMSWNTSEGIDTYCELNGDMYIGSGEEIQENPDVIMVYDKEVNYSTIGAVFYAVDGETFQKKIDKVAAGETGWLLKSETEWMQWADNYLSGWENYIADSYDEVNWKEDYILVMQGYQSSEGLSHLKIIEKVMIDDGKLQVYVSEDYEDWSVIQNNPKKNRYYIPYYIIRIDAQKVPNQILCHQALKEITGHKTESTIPFVGTERVFHEVDEETYGKLIKENKIAGVVDSEAEWTAWASEYFPEWNTNRLIMGYWEMADEWEKKSLLIYRGQKNVSEVRLDGEKFQVIESQEKEDNTFVINTSEDVKYVIYQLLWIDK